MKQPFEQIYLPLCTYSDIKCGLITRWIAINVVPNSNATTVHVNKEVSKLIPTNKGVFKYLVITAVFICCSDEDYFTTNCDILVKIDEVRRLCEDRRMIVDIL